MVDGPEGWVLFFSASVLMKDRKEVVKDEAYQIQSLCLSDGDVNPDTHTNTPQKQANTQNSNEQTCYRWTERDEVLWCRNAHYFQIDYKKYFYFYKQEFFCLP